LREDNRDPVTLLDAHPNETVTERRGNRVVLFEGEALPS